MKSISTGITVFVFFVLVSACSRSDGGTNHSFTISSDDGVTIAWNENGPRTLGNIFKFEPVLKLQQDPENEESLLFGPNEFTMDQEGNFYVSDARNSRIAVFNHLGEYVRAFGREGQGPGEFIFMSNLLIQGDVVSAYDFRQRRRTFFRTDGTLIKVVTVPATVLGNTEGSIMDLHVLDDDRLYILRWNTRGTVEAEFFHAGFSVYNSEADTLWALDSPWIQNGIWAMQPTGRKLSFYHGFLGMPSIHYVYGKGILLANGTSQDLIWYDADGTVINELKLGLPQVSFTNEDRDKLRAVYQRRIAEARAEDDDRRVMMYQTQMEAFYFPTYKPYWGDLKVDDHGYLWLRITEHSVDREAAGGGYRYRVISPDGEYLGDTRIQYSTRFTIVNGKLLVVWTPPDAEDVELLVCDIKAIGDDITYPN